MARRFTPREANEELREIRPLVEELVEHRREQRRVQAEREALAHRIAGNGGGIDSGELAGLEEAERRRVNPAASARPPDAEAQALLDRTRTATLGAALAAVKTYAQQH